MFFHIPEPHQLRSLGGALCDLVQKYDRTPIDHPFRLDLGRMIRVLAIELTRVEVVPLRACKSRKAGGRERLSNKPCQAARMLN